MTLRVLLDYDGKLLLSGIGLICFKQGTVSLPRGPVIVERNLPQEKLYIPGGLTMDGAGWSWDTLPSCTSNDSSSMTELEFEAPLITTEDMESLWYAWRKLEHASRDAMV